ncbi:MAG TPA: phosphoribosyltransferase family protein [Ramlibacter sp.]|jgi:ComF family protein|uniref:ComF family protein n=1 Tax=Ramlibacter sp. TaxID=1917967 RepID=UPI002D28C151|nr:phosphoribosyltransferase family protein [Ramlibacter sp.]HZY19887.1 phosphoribosyltransferase family protein [Ramlibacter sp.]
MFTQLVRRCSQATPALCEVCHAWPAGPVCGTCIAGFGAPRHRCLRCAIGLPEGVPVCGTCLRSPPPLDACHAAVSYGYPWAGLIGRYKFSGEAGWAETFAALAARAPAVASLCAAAHRVVPMPLSRERLAQRGFNQAHELARRLAPAKADPHLAVRLRDTPPQSALDLAARRANVRNAFALEPARAADVRGRAVLLVDDVMTTGASLFALAGVFRAAGASAVAAVVLARTEEP